jgi:hypothetical protein
VQMTFNSRISVILTSTDLFINAHYGLSLLYHLLKCKQSNKVFKLLCNNHHSLKPLDDLLQLLKIVVVNTSCRRKCTITLIQAQILSNLFVYCGSDWAEDSENMQRVIGMWECGNLGCRKQVH